MRIFLGLLHWASSRIAGFTARYTAAVNRWLHRHPKLRARTQGTRATVRWFATGIGGLNAVIQFVLRTPRARRFWTNIIIWEAFFYVLDLWFFFLKSRSSEFLFGQNLDPEAELAGFIEWLASSRYAEDMLHAVSNDLIERDSYYEMVILTYLAVRDSASEQSKLGRIILNAQDKADQFYAT